MSGIRKAAKGQRCQVRLPGICNHNPETVVLAHYRLAGMCGTGIKPSDLLGAFACSSCHDCIDGRTKTDLNGRRIETGARGRRDADAGYFGKGGAGSGCLKSD